MKFMKVCYLDGGSVMRINEHITEAGGCPFTYRIARLENFQYNIDATIMPFVRENLIAQRFEKLFVKTKYKEAIKFVKANTLAKFHNVRVKAGQTPQWLQYFGMLLTRRKFNAIESLEFSRIDLNQNMKYLLEKGLVEDKFECREELQDLVQTMDDDLMLKIHIETRTTPKVIATIINRREFDFNRICRKLFPHVEYNSHADLFFLQTVLCLDPTNWIFLAAKLVIELLFVGFHRVVFVYKLKYASKGMIMALDSLLGCMTKLPFKGSMEKAICRWDKEMTWFYCSTTSLTGVVKAEDDNMKEVRNILQMRSNFRDFGSNNVNEHSSRSRFMLCIMANSKNIKIIVDASAYVDAFGADISALEVKKKRQRQYLEEVKETLVAPQKRAMKIVCNDDKFVTYLENVVDVDIKQPMLIDKYLIVAVEIDIDALVDLDFNPWGQGSSGAEGIVMSLVEERKGIKPIDVIDKPSVVVVSKDGIRNYSAGQA
ncbi:hypothetical protein V6N12_051444 [Hibiscus sabdariffa]|uniref:Uncharacterized protein n=1 Tax=Hibiscus sabdariffa TaxID=183260 RepID=A0ABR2GFL1_9ROSI